MILRPVRPVSARGPPSSKRPGRVGQDLVAVVGVLGGDDRADHVVAQVGLEQGLEVEPGSCWVEMSTVFEPDRAAVLVLER